MLVDRSCCLTLMHVRCRVCCCQVLQGPCSCRMLCDSRAVLLPVPPSPGLHALHVRVGDTSASLKATLLVVSNIALPAESTCRFQQCSDLHTAQ